MVSTNMLHRVMLRTSTYNNELAVAKSWVKSLVKMAYYYCVAAVYGAAGGCSNVSFACCTCMCCDLLRLLCMASACHVVMP